jgi:hypothetical protein
MCDNRDHLRTLNFRAKQYSEKIANTHQIKAAELLNVHPHIIITLAIDGCCDFYVLPFFDSDLDGYANNIKYSIRTKKAGYNKGKANRL